MIDLDIFRKNSYCSNIEVRSVNVLEPTESIFSPVTIDPFNIEPSIISDYWHRFINISDINPHVKSHLVPCILSGVEIEPQCVVKLFCDHPYSTWEHVSKKPSRP